MGGISFNGLVLGLLLVVLAILVGSLHYGRWEFVSLTDQGNGVKGQEWKQVPAEKKEPAQKENDVPVLPKKNGNEHGVSQAHKER